MGGFHGPARSGGFSGGRWGGGGGYWGGRPWGGRGWGNGFHHGPFPRGGRCWGGNCFYHHYNYGYGYPGYGYGYWPYAYAGWGWDYPWYDDYDDSDNYQAQAPPSNEYYQPPPADYQSQAEIDRLHDEVARLRDQVQSGSNSVPRPPEAKESAPEPTQLVFADKHTEQIENYAIVRQNLWVFDGSRTRKIPLSSLDIAATQKANEDQGVDFEIPN